MNYLPGKKLVLFYSSSGQLLILPYLSLQVVDIGVSAEVKMSVVPELSLR